MERELIAEIQALKAKMAGCLIGRNW